MSAPILNFLPDSVGREVRCRRSRRRTGGLALVLVGLSAVAGLHSLHSIRAAQAQFDAEQVKADQVERAAMEKLANDLASEQAELEQDLRVADGLVPAVTTASVVATVTNMLPEHTMLHALRIEAEDTPRQFQVLLKGCAGGNGALTELEQRLADCPAFTGVTVSERKASESMGRRVEEFTVSFQVPLEVQFRKPGSVRVAMGGER